MKGMHFSTLKRFVEAEVGRPLNTDIFWGTQPIFVPFKEQRKAYFRVLHNLGRVSTKIKPHKKDNGNTLHNGLVFELVRHLIVIGKIPEGSYKVIPDEKQAS